MVRYRLCTPTLYRSWYGCVGVTAATDLFNIPDRSCPLTKKSRRESGQKSKTEDEERMQAAWRKKEREKQREQRGQRVIPAAFIQLKEILCSDPVLPAPNFDEAILLQTDESKEGLSAVLSQADHKGTCVAPSML